MNTIFQIMISLLVLLVPTSCEGATVERAFSLSRDVVSEMLITPSIILFIGTILLGVCIFIRIYQRNEINSYYQDRDEEYKQKLAGTFVPIENSDGEVVSTIPIQIAPLIVILKMSYPTTCWRIPHSNQERNATHMKSGILSFILGLGCLIAFLIPMSIGFSVVNNVMYITSNVSNIPNSFQLYYSNYIYACCLEVYNSYYALDQATYITTSTYDLNVLVKGINSLYCAIPQQNTNTHNGTIYGNFIDQVRGRAQAIEYAKTSCNAGAVIFVPDILETVVATGSCGISLGLLFFIFGIVCFFMGRNLSQDLPQYTSNNTIPVISSVMMNELPEQNQNSTETESSDFVLYSHKMKKEQKSDPYCKE
ncbi:predicted protein [Naegleria gruberi]|uniref:Predicted protein n=1 Tax=Naegleria gruberi TaxID=5762 RepID=D2W4U3_NAEGR|nr:uncharacterized protein NAEGRDRAFT_76429 [Naegleria gruberi]EFC35910.1 predicted protein [Naegleria gruberi]|eukprot:XP_002668654.1 predicted protein [Naegleria gruberi strain NEG-M]